MPIASIAVAVRPIASNTFNTSVARNTPMTTSFVFFIRLSSMEQVVVSIAPRLCALSNEVGSALPIAAKKLLFEDSVLTGAGGTVRKRRVTLRDRPLAGGVLNVQNFC